MSKIDGIKDLAKQFKKRLSERQSGLQLRADECQEGMDELSDMADGIENEDITEEDALEIMGTVIEIIESVCDNDTESYNLKQEFRKLRDE